MNCRKDGNPTNERIWMPIDEYTCPYAKLAGAKCNSIVGLLILNDQRRNLIPICYGDQVSDEIECSKH